MRLREKNSKSFMKFQLKLKNSNEINFLKKKTINNI